MKARTAVIPAAGLGTRFYPVTSVVPKELLPIVDVPALQLVLDEAIGAGIEHVVLVSKPHKRAVEEYLTPRPEVIAVLREAGRDATADRLSRIGTDVRVTVVHQDEVAGLGRAVWCARHAVGDESFAVMLPDEIVADSRLLSSLIGAVEATGSGAVGVDRVSRDRLSSYGVVVTEGTDAGDGPFVVRGMVEKPRPEDAPSGLALMGRYVLTPDVFAEIEPLRPAANGEVQFTEALTAQARRRPFTGIMLASPRWDIGTPEGWVAAVVDAALADERLAAKVRAHLRGALAD
jgi:UTP--glucose-1-phosphate uridylyltransferase